MFKIEIEICVVDHGLTPTKRVIGQIRLKIERVFHVRLNSEYWEMNITG